MYADLLKKIDLPMLWKLYSTILYPININNHFLSTKYIFFNQKYNYRFHGFSFYRPLSIFSQIESISHKTISNSYDLINSKVYISSTSSEHYYLPYKYRNKEKHKQYTLIREIGHGMFATVYSAVDNLTGRKVAVKALNKRSTPRDLCERELRILEQVSEQKVHSRLTPIFDAYENSEELCFVLELMAGDLFDYVSQSGPLPEVEAANVTRKLCYAIGALHSSGILHRDIKLENLLIESGSNDLNSSTKNTDHFKISDFGFAKKINEEDNFYNPAGTLGYAAPEVLTYRQYGPACDIWSAGVVLYIMLVGYHPFPLKTDVKLHELSLDEKLKVEYEAIIFNRENDRWLKHLSQGVWMNISLNAKKLVSKNVMYRCKEKIFNQSGY